MGKEAFIGFSKKKEFNYPISNLKKHFVALGSSGSGKTVFSKIMIEECIRNDIPAIVVDPQGDLASLALFGEKEDILEKGIPEEKYEEFKEKARITIFTPISSKGIPICINPLNIEKLDVEEEEIIPVLNSVATSIAKLLGYDTNKDKGKSAEAILYTVIKHYYNTDEEIGTFDNLANILSKIDGAIRADINQFIKDEKDLKLLIRKLKFLGVGEKELLFQFGVPLNIETLLSKDDGKTQISIIYLNTLPNQDEKEFFLSILTTQLYQWMLANPSDDVQCLYFIDEIAPFIPAGSEKPMPKPILKLLFKQARKYGIACGIATQNPGDIDYKAFAQFGTWAIGRMPVRQDQKKIELALKSVSSKQITSKLPKLKPGEFLMFAPDISPDIIELNTRWLYTQHKTLNDSAVKKIMDPIREEYADMHIKRNKKDISKLGEKIVEDLKPHGGKIEFGEGKKPLDKDELLYFTHITKEEAMKIAESNKKRILGLGPKKEEIIDFNLDLVPYIKTKIRCSEKKLFGMKKEMKEYTLFFDGLNGDIVLVKKNRFTHRKMRNLIDLQENSIKVMAALTHAGKNMSSSELAVKVSLTQAYVTKVLNNLFKKKLVSYRKISRYYQWFPIVDLDLKTLSEANSTGYSIEVGKLEGRKIKAKVNLEDLSRIVRNWFGSAEIVEDETVYLPQYTIKYHSKGKTRALKINSANAKIIKD